MYVPHLYASFPKQRALSAAASSVVPAVVPAAAAPVVVPTPSTDYQRSCSAFVFVTQISILTTSVDPRHTSNHMPLAFVSTPSYITIMLYPGVSIHVVFDTGSGVNIMFFLLLLWLQLVAPSAVVKVYDFEDSCYPFVPIRVCGVTADASADPSFIRGHLTKIAVLYTCHIITIDGLLSPLLLTFGIGSDVPVNACLVIATIKALDLLFDPVDELVCNDSIGLCLPCPLHCPDPSCLYLLCQSRS